MTGWADDIVEEDTEDGEELRSDGDILGDVQVNTGGRRRRQGTEAEIPFEEQWETDMEAFLPGKVSASCSFHRALFVARLLSSCR